MVTILSNNNINYAGLKYNSDVEKNKNTDSGKSNIKFTSDNIESIDLAPASKTPENAYTDTGTGNNKTIDVDKFVAEYSNHTLTDEELRSFIGKMSYEEYSKFIDGIKKYYTEENENYEIMLENINEMLNLIDEAEFKLASERGILDDPRVSSNSRIYEINFEYQMGYHDDVLEAAGLTKEDYLNMSEEEQFQFLAKNDKAVKQELENIEYSTLTLDQKVSELLKDELGITTEKEMLEQKAYLEEMQRQLTQAIQINNNMIESAQYDYLYYLEDYNNFEVKDINRDLLDVIDDSKYMTLGGSQTVMQHIYSYESFHKDYPEVSPLEFVMLVKEKNGNEPLTQISIRGIENYETIATIADAAEDFPNFEKMYFYMYEKSPEEAKKYLEACKYELTNIEGQYRAEAFLSGLYESENSDSLELLANELNVSVEGLKDGLTSFGEGAYYSLEAFATALGIIDENRQMTAEEYKRMFILQALLSPKAKEEAGLIVKDENGNYVNANPNSIIDYTKTYSGGVTLQVNYEVSQGIGNMLPSIALSAINPAAGSVALGLSAGGNAYHSSMVQGDDLWTAICYGIFTGSSEAITERLLGGLPGLSNTQVKSLSTYLKSMGKEAFQEGFQGIMDAVYQAMFMGNPLPSTPEEWEAFSKDILKQAGYGALTAGILNIPNYALKIGIMQQNPKVNRGRQFNPNFDDVLFFDQLPPKQRQVFLNQLELFNEIKTSNFKNNQNLQFTMDGKLIINEGALIHGTIYDEKIIDSISNNGILSGQFFGIAEDGETFFCADFFKVNQATTLEQYTSSISQKILINGIKIDSNESRYLPSNRPYSGRMISFIVNPSNETQQLLSKDPYKNDAETLDIVNEDAISDFQKDSLSSILVGVPENAISAVVVGNEITPQEISYLSSKFPGIPIVNVNGEVVNTFTFLNR